jgi:hypothetical protein
MIRVVKAVEDRGVAQDDQQLAAIDTKIKQGTKRRDKLNASLRELRRKRAEIIERRALTDSTV